LAPCLHCPHLAAITVAGLAAGPINSLLASAGSFFALPFGVLLAGCLIELVGLTTTILVIAAGYLLIILSLLANRALRRLRHPPNTPTRRDNRG
jgi:membrane protein implicated in regulation of membrane protease activity